MTEATRRSPTTARRSASLVDQVTDGVTQQIKSGDYPLGSLLPSAKDLAELWGVSVSVIRETISRLSAVRLVVAQQGRGVFVAQQLPPHRLELVRGDDADSIARIIELRMGVEVEAAALAAMNRDKQDLKGMRNALNRMAKAIVNGDVQAGIDADIDFHCGICTATGNEHFEALFVFLNQYFYRNISMSRQNSASSAGKGGSAQAEHAEIFDAIQAQDVQRARRSARNHIVNTARRLGLELKDTDPQARSEL